MFEISSNSKSCRKWTSSVKYHCQRRHDNNCNDNTFCFLKQGKYLFALLSIGQHVRFTIREMYIAFSFTRVITFRMREINIAFHSTGLTDFRTCFSSTWIARFLTREIFLSFSLGKHPFRTRKILIAVPSTSLDWHTFIARETYISQFEPDVVNW